MINKINNFQQNIPRVSKLWVTPWRQIIRSLGFSSCCLGWGQSCSHLWYSCLRRRKMKQHSTPCLTPTGGPSSPWLRWAFKKLWVLTTLFFKLRYDKINDKIEIMNVIFCGRYFLFLSARQVMLNCKLNPQQCWQFPGLTNLSRITSLSAPHWKESTKSFGLNT